MSRQESVWLSRRRATAAPLWLKIAETEKLTSHRQRPLGGAAQIARDRPPGIERLFRPRERPTRIGLPADGFRSARLACAANRRGDGVEAVIESNSAGGGRLRLVAPCRNSRNFALRLRRRSVIRHHPADQIYSPNEKEKKEKTSQRAEFSTRISPRHSKTAAVDDARRTTAAATRGTADVGDVEERPTTNHTGLVFNRKHRTLGHILIELAAG